MVPEDAAPGTARLVSPAEMPGVASWESGPGLAAAPARLSVGTDAAQGPGAWGKYRQEAVPRGVELAGRAPWSALQNAGEIGDGEKLA